MTKLEKLLRRHYAAYGQQNADATSDEYYECARLYGGSLRALGRWTDALEVFQNALTIARSARDRGRIREFLIWISNVHYHCGRYNRAIEVATKALCECESASERVRIIRYYLGKPVLRAGDVERYNELVSEAISIYDDGVQSDVHPWLQCDKAYALFLLGNPQEAAILVSRQVDTFRKIGHRFGLPWSLLLMGEILTESDLCAADAALAEAVSLYGENGQEGFVVDGLRLRSKVRYLQNRIDESIELIEGAIVECRKGPRQAEGLADKYHLLQVLLWRNKLLLDVGDRSNVVDTQEEIRSLLENCDSPQLYRKWIENEARLGEQSMGSTEGKPTRECR